MRFKKLSINNMPRVFVAILAMDDGGAAVVGEFRPALRRRAAAVARKLGIATAAAARDIPDAKLLHAILELDRDERAKLVPILDEVLEEMADQDAFGTEGQLDPRGDRRG